MKLEYKNGVRVTKMYHELTPLDAAIRLFEEKAEKHYDSINNKGTKGKLTANQEEEKRKALSFLDQERRTLDAIASVQGQLAEYRERGLDATRGSEQQQVQAAKILAKEKHHPTAILEEYMRAEGTPKPSPIHTAHHIVPGKGKLKQVTARARAYMHSYGIRINDPANGVYLLTVNASVPHWSMPKSHGHLKYHTHEYENWVAKKVRSHTNMDAIKTELQLVGRLLQLHGPHSCIGS